MNLLDVKNVGKAFRTYKTEWHRFARWFGLPVEPVDETWVLRDVSFSIRPGDALGIVGQNGAGKSTLLKIITGTMQPSEGSVLVNGRVAAILELGMGFNPDISGRENVIHSAGVMGLGYEQIHSLMPEIEAFAEIGDYFDLPVRTYSSGMQMRVAFAVATAARPEILIIDEALSVGDTYFQHKSFARIKKFREEGTSLLFVSHDPSAIRLLCNRAILMENGSVIKEGEPSEVVDYYNALIAKKEDSSEIYVKKMETGEVKTRSGTGDATIESIVLLNDKGEQVETICVGEAITIKTVAVVNKPLSQLVWGFGIRDRLGQTIFGTNTFHTDQIVENPVAGNRIEFRMDLTANLGPGSYSLQIALHSGGNHLSDNYDWDDMALVFKVINQSLPTFVGSYWADPVIKISSVR